VEIDEVLTQAVQLMFMAAQSDGAMSAATGGVTEDGSIRVATLTLTVATLRPEGAK
jgi:hypothetical protein